MSDSPTTRHFRIAGLLLASLVLCTAILVSAALIVYKAPLLNALTLATTHQPERFTELSFDNAGYLPLYAAPAKTEKFSFRVVNHEAATTTYRYLVTITASGTTSVLDNGTVTLADGAQSDYAVQYIIRTPNVAAQISVWLLGRSEFISFRSHS